jgi:hypothetical protein
LRPDAGGEREVFEVLAAGFAPDTEGRAEALGALKRITGARGVGRSTRRQVETWSHQASIYRHDDIIQDTLTLDMTFDCAPIRKSTPCG